MPIPNCFDPYLRYAISTEFRYFDSFDPAARTFELFFLVELMKPGTEDDNIATALNSYNSSFHVKLGPAASSSRYVTMRSRRAAVVDLDQGAVDIWQAYVSRVELSLPLPPETPESQLHQRFPGVGLARKVLIGVLDDGCPFAAAQFLAAGGDATRVWAIWDQNPDKRPVECKDGSGNDCLFGHKPKDFKYGLEFWRGSVPAYGRVKKQIGLNEWIELHKTPSDSIDEDGCYADAGGIDQHGRYPDVGFRTLRFRESHGAHVTDVLAGRVPPSSRISQDPANPPTFGPDGDDASAADIVFVQFPENCIRDATGVWLKAYVVDGIRYILSFADPKNVDTVIINVSYGPSTGPHNGTAVLEEALTELVTWYDGVANKPKLEIGLAVGNSYLTQGHVNFIGNTEEPGSVQWTWRLPPDNTALCFAEVWMSNADAGGVKVTLTSPSGVVFTSTTVGATAGMDGPIAWGGDDTMWRLQVEPTVAGSGIVAEHGDYTITIAGVVEGAQVDAYVARTDPNMDVYTGAKLSYFVDANWELTSSAEADCTYVNGEFDNTGSLVSRYGTLNGIATAESPSVHVAGGYILSNARKSTYSSAGPARGGPFTLRKGPDDVLICDESCALEGLLAGGNRSGAVFRLIGTSTAAPQLARWFADGGPPAPTDVPDPSDVEAIEQRGGGNVTSP
jgi:hypothetical protein